MVNRIRNRKKSVIIFISIAIALVGLVFLISAIVVSCNRDRRDELVFYIYVGPEKITYPGFRSKAQADEMVESGELKLLCELQNYDMGDQYTLAYEEGKNQYLYIKYGIKDEERLLDFYVDDNGIDLDIGINKEINLNCYSKEKFEIASVGEYGLYFTVNRTHKLYKDGGSYCIINVK